MQKEIADKILRETEQGYDFMASKFSDTRKFFWRGLEFIGDYAKGGGKILDFGCGNGRLIELIGRTENLQYNGVDVSQELINIASQRYPNQTFQKINPLQTTLPFATNYFNTSYSIAVFHHFPSKKYREDIAKELYRITQKDGHIIITAWNLWQKRYIKNIFKNWSNKIKGSTLEFLKVEPSKQLDWNDCHISFTNNAGNKFQRFHHAFTKKELKKLFAGVGFEIERCEIIDDRNIILIGKK